MSRRIYETKTRSALKGLTERVMEVVFDTVVLLFIGVNAGESLAIAVTFETVCFGLMFLNERLWNLSDFGRLSRVEKE